MKPINPMKHHLLNATKNQSIGLQNRMETNNRGIQSTDNGDGTNTYSVGGKGSLMQAFFSGQIDRGGSRRPGDDKSSYSTGVLAKQAEALNNVLANGNLSTQQQDAVKLQLELNNAMQSSDSDSNGKVTMGEWANYIKENANENGKLNFTC